MKLISLNTVAIALVLLGVSGVIVPTAAVTNGPADEVWDEPAISLEPAEGPNGQYASVGADGNLSVDLSEVNPEAVTVVRDVFTITNNDDAKYRVWVSHDAAAAVTFFLDGSRSLQDVDNPLVLPAGARTSVSLVIDARGRSGDDVLMSTLTLHAEGAATPTPTPTPVPTATPQSGGTPAVTPTATPTTPSPTPTTPVPTPEPGDEESIEVVFDVRTGDGQTPGPGEPADAATIREMDLSELDEDPTAPPRAVINHSSRGPVEFGSEEPALTTGRYDVITEANRPVSLSGTRSLIGQVDGVDNQRRVIKLIDIQVPEDRRDERATVRITVSRAKFGDTDPGEAVIGHRADGGWQLLDTRVVSSSERTVTLEARTPGFSAFGVFVENQVRYEWTLPDGSTYEGKQVRSQFDEPGRYNATLTVTDSFGRSDAAVYRILVNDRPTVTIEGLASAGGDDLSTLRANVTNEFGNATVTWLFADGSTTTGDTVTREFAKGEAVRVTVVDEYGAEGRAAGVIGQAAGDSGRPSVGLVQFNLGLRTRIAAVGLAVVFLVMGLRWLAARRYDVA